MKKIYLFSFLFCAVFILRAQNVLFINGADNSAPTLYTAAGLGVYINGGITVNQAGSPGGATNNYLQNNGVIHIQQSAQSDFTNNVAGLKTFSSGQTTGEVIFADNNQTQSITGGGTVEFMNLTVNNTLSPKVNLSEDVIVDDTLKLGGVINVQSNNLTLLSSGVITGAPFTTANMIQADGTGQFIRGVSIGPGTDLFPVGDGAPAYSPVTINFVSNASAGTVGVNVKPVAHPQINSPNTALDYIKRYWSFSNTGLTTYSYSGNFKYASSDIVGTESLMKVSRWANPWYQQAGSSAAANTLTIASSLDQTMAPLTGDFTGRNTACTTSAGAITALSDSICTGNSQNLSVTGNTTSVQWQSSVTSSNFTDIPGADSTTYLSHVSQTTYYRTYAAGGGCSDTSIVFKLVVNALPSLPTLTLTDSLICSNDSTEICASGGYSSYIWSTGASSSCIQAVNAGGYWVTVTGLNGCSVTSGHVNIRIFPVSSVSIIENGDTLSSYGGTSYQWYYNGNPISGATSNVDIAQQTGGYSVQVTDTNGCKAMSSEIPVILGTNDLAENMQLKFYPNPTSGVFNISYSGSTSSWHMLLFNGIGEKVIEEILNFGNGETIPVNVSQLLAGVYLVQLQSGQHSRLERIVVQ